MKSLMPDEFTSNSFMSPKQVLEEQARYLANLTNKWAIITIDKMYLSEAITTDHCNDFHYILNLRSGIRDAYSKRIMSFSYDILYYPIKITIEQWIAVELKLKDKVYIKNENEFLALIEVLFNSALMKSLIGTITQKNGNWYFRD